MKCTVCTHPQHHAIDQALLAGDATYEALSRQYGPSLSAIYRHKKHLETKTRRARARLRDNLSLGFFCKLNNFLAQIQNAAQTADAEGNAAVVLKAATSGPGLLPPSPNRNCPWSWTWFTASWPRPSGPPRTASCPPTRRSSPTATRPSPPACSSPAPTLPPYRLPRTKLTTTTKMTGMKYHRRMRPVRLPPLPNYCKDSTLAPAPLHPHFSKLGTQNSKLPQPPTRNWQPKTKREFSAKKARNYREIRALPRRNNKQYQYDNISEKTSAKNPCVGRDPQGGASQSDAPPAVQTCPLCAPREHPKSGQPPINQSKLPTNLSLSACAASGPKLPPPPNTPATPSCSMRSISRKKPRPWPSSRPPRPRRPPTPSQTPPTPHSNLQNPAPDTPKPLEPLCPKKNLGDWLFALAHGYRRDNPPKHIPDRRWEEDFGNPRNFW